MKGLTLQATKALEVLINGNFNSIGLDFLGLIPKVSREKKIIFTTNKNSLTSLFLQALGNRNPNKDEEETLKVLLRISNGYVEALKERTKAKVIHRVDGYLKDTSTDHSKSTRIHDIFNEEMNKARNHFKLIANCESNKAVNTGTALQIKRVGDSQGVEDPTVFFIVTVDDVTGSEEFKLHLLPDRKTPRVWKLSEIGSEYHKKGDWNPKFPGLHPNCRCKLTYLAKGWGFDAGGRIKYKGKGYDELQFQRGKHGLPREKKLEKAYKDHQGKWRLEDHDKHGTEHPENKFIANKFDHQIAHKTNSGKMVWTPKNMKFDKQPVTSEQMDGAHRHYWKQYAETNKIPKDSDFRNTLVELNKQVINDKDRHLRLSGTSGHKNPQHTEIRQRHLINALRGKQGYQIEHVTHPETQQHLGVRVKAERHPQGQKHETSWFFDGNSLKTEYDKPKKD